VSWSHGPWVADTSAWARSSAPPVAHQWKQAAQAGDLVGCPVVIVELLYDARDSEEVQRVATALAGLEQARITGTVTDAAIAAVCQLAAGGSAGSHPVRVPDAVIAASAAERGFAVLHYDRLAEALAFHSQWVAPEGSIP